MHKPISLVLLGLAGVGLLFMLAVFARDYGTAPAIVATHFGVSGAPDAWGPKSTFLIFPIVGLVVFVLAVLMTIFGLPSSRTPVPAILPVVAGLAFAELVWILALAEVGTFDVAFGRAAGLSPAFSVGIVAVMLTGFAVVIVALRTAAKARR